MRLSALVIIVACAGCGAPEATPTVDETASAIRREANPNPALYEKDARPYGRSIEHWSERLWAYIYAQPFATNPFFDTSGANCGSGQEGPVWFLPSVPGATLGTTVTRSCTIPRHRSIILQLASAMNDFPCPDPNFKPAPGQSLYDFLISPISPGIDGVTGFTATLDGAPLADVLDYRFTSDDVFFFRGDPTLEQWDSCVTTHRQEAVSDGYYLMFKPLSPGAHQIVVHGQDMEGTQITLTESLTID